MITWGGENSGGDSRRVQHELIHVQQIYATHRAFAALLQDETVPCFDVSNPRGDMMGSPNMYTVDVWP